jgi:hypothetical protein
MNSFEQYTLIIGLLAIAIEAARHLKAKVMEWFHADHHKSG